MINLESNLSNLSNLNNITLILLHGWAANGHIFDTIIPKFPQSWQIIAPHLLGHGDQTHSINLNNLNHLNNPNLKSDFNLENATAQIAQLIENHHDNYLNNQIFILGWSLGGAIALSLAKYFNQNKIKIKIQIKGLILMNTFAKFLADEHYSAGLKQSSLHKMLPFFQSNYTQTMRQFLELQLLLLENTQKNQIIEKILPAVAQWGTPHALESALNAALDFDIRADLPQLNQANLLIYGDKDTITPPKMGEYLAQHLPHSSFHVIKKAAHAPFLSHSDECAVLIHEFISSNIN